MEKEKILVGYHAKITGLTKIQTNEERPVING